MSTSKKPRKPYKPKLQVWPLGIRSQQRMELPGYLASLALGQEHFAEQHVYDLVGCIDLVRRTAPEGHEILPVAHAMVLACAEIQHRAQRTGKHGVTGDEMRVLRENIGKALDFLRTVPNVAIARAVLASVADFDRTGVLRV
jgi:hypothetical protein